MGYVADSEFDGLQIDFDAQRAALARLAEKWGEAPHDLRRCAPNPAECRLLEEFLRDWGYETRSDNDFCLTQARWLGYNYYGAEQEWVWQTIAPCIGDGAINWVGEDSRHWRFVFKDGEMVVQDARVVYD